jgi:hypothetical protein
VASLSPRSTSPEMRSALPSRCRPRVPPRGALLASLLCGGALLAPAGQVRAATLPLLSINVNPSSITVAGALQSGAVNVVSTITGLPEASSILLQLNPGVSAEEVYAFLGSSAANDPNNIERYGAIVFDAEVSASARSEIQTQLLPGTYLALAGAGAGPPRLHASFTVPATAAPAVMPTPQATIRTIDFGFRGPSVLHHGELVRFQNDGFLVHMDIAARTRSRSSAGRLLGALRAGTEQQIDKLVSGPPAAFTGPLSQGAYQQETITATPGWYVQVSLMNTQDGRDDAFLGMERIIRILK